MGRVLLLLLVIAAVVLLWMAFKPSTWKRSRGINQAQAPKQVKGPDDDEEFLWTIEKTRFKQRRAQESAEREEEERMKRARERYVEPDNGSEGSQSEEKTDDDGENPETQPS